MSKKIIQVYDGTVYKNIVGKEILINEKSTGHYEKISEQQTTVYGQYLDSQTNQAQLKKDIEELRLVNGYLSRNGLLTDYKNFNSFLLNYVRSNANKIAVDSWYDWVIAIILQLGYVNKEYHFDKENKIIKFPISPKDGSQNDFTLTLLAIDENSYILN